MIKGPVDTLVRPRLTRVVFKVLHQVVAFADVSSVPEEHDLRREMQTL